MAIAGLPIEMKLSRRSFYEGFSSLPFNLPDFPVPTHRFALTRDGKLSPFQVAQVAAAVSSIFSVEQLGLDSVKDFFHTGLLSIEEVQIALPWLVPLKLVEKAVLRVIHDGAHMLTWEDWKNLVIPFHSSEDIGTGLYATLLGLSSCGGEKSSDDKPVNAFSVDTGPCNTLEAGKLDGGNRINKNSFPKASNSAPNAASTQPDVETHPDKALDTQPCDHSKIQREGHASSATGEISRPEHCISIDWSTPPLTKMVTLSPGSHHQADEGAGAQPIPLKKSLVGREKIRHVNDMASLLSVDLHNECIGPFLARAFARCCQLYVMKHFGDPAEPESCTPSSLQE